MYLDNSTALVLHADKYKPTLSNELLELAKHYNTIAWALPPGLPRGKASVECAVGLVQQWIYPDIKEQKFFSLEEINKALRLACDNINNLPLHEKFGETRNERFEREKPHLKRLPVEPYEKSVIIKVLTVRSTSQIRYDDHRYSVPYRYIKSKVTVVIKTKQKRLLIYDRDTAEKIAEHPLRDHSDSTVSTINVEHLPAYMRHRVEPWTETLERLRLDIGPFCHCVCSSIVDGLDKKSAKRLLDGIEAQGRRIGPLTLESCCHQAYDSNQASYEELIALCEQVQTTTHIEAKTTKHGSNVSVHKSTNLRGSDYYKNAAHQMKENQQ